MGVKHDKRSLTGFPEVTALIAFCLMDEHVLRSHLSGIQLRCMQDVCLVIPLLSQQQHPHFPLYCFIFNSKQRAGRSAHHKMALHGMSPSGDLMVKPIMLYIGYIGNNKHYIITFLIEPIHF